jgi:hypothetical protein
MKEVVDLVGLVVFLLVVMFIRMNYLSIKRTLNENKKYKIHEAKRVKYNTLNYDGFSESEFIDYCLQNKHRFDSLFKVDHKKIEGRAYDYQWSTKRYTIKMYAYDYGSVLKGYYEIYKNPPNDYNWIYREKSTK